MHDCAVEEKHITRVHDDGFDLCPLGNGNSNISETLSGIGFGRAQDRPLVAARYNLQTSVSLIARVHSHPRGHARTGLCVKVILVLVQCLTACPGWLEVEHGLGCKWLTPE